MILSHSSSDLCMRNLVQTFVIAIVDFFDMMYNMSTKTLAIFSRCS